MLIYVLNRKEELLTALHNDTELCGVLDFNITEDLVETNTLEFTVSGDVDGAEFLTKGNYVVTQNLAGVWKMFVIQTTRDSHGDVTTKSVYAEDYTIELGDLPIGVDVPTGEIDITTTIPAILAGTGVVVDKVDTPFIKPSITENTSRSSKLSVLNYLAGSCGMTILTSVDVSQMPAKPIVKKVSVVEFNKSEGKRFEFDGNLVSIEREEDNTAIKTAVIALGKALEQSEEDKEAGKPVEYITIKDVVWSTANGDLLDKPAGADILINPEATAINGVKDSAGKFQPKVAVIHFNEIEDPEELALKAYWELEKLVKPRTSFTFTANDIVADEDDGNNAVELGDKCYVIDNSVTPPIVEEVVVRRLSGNPDSKESMGIEIGTPQATLVDEDLSTQITNTIKNNGLISGNFTDLTAINAEIKNLKADKASITDLEAVKIKTETIEAEVGVINTLVSGNITSDNIHSSGITSDKLVISNGFIKDAMIETLSVDKIQAGTIDTGKISIASKDGGIVIEDNTQQFKDKNGKVRIQMGQDSKGEFSFGLFDESGTGTLIDSTGVKEGALGNDIIKEHMVSENAIGDKQIDYNKFTTGFNADTNTSTLKSSKVQLDGTNQTIDIAFNEMNTTVNNIQVGGRNLFRGSGNFTELPSNAYWVSNGGGLTLSEETYNEYKTFKTSVFSGVHGAWYSLENNVEYTYSVLMKSDKAFTGSDSVPLHYHAGKDMVPDNKITVTGFDTNYPVANVWKKLYVTFKLVQDARYFRPFIYGGGTYEEPQFGNWTIANLQLEKGNKATDWTPALEDVQSQITANSTEIKVQQGKIDTAIKNTTIVKDGKELLLKDEYSKLEQTVGGISTTVGNHTSSLTDLGTKVASNTSSIQQNADKIALKVESTDITNAINGVKVGATNLLMYSGSTITNNHYCISQFETYPALKPNTKYTVVFKGTCDDRTRFNIHWNSGALGAWTFDKTVDGLYRAVIVSPENVQNHIQFYNWPQTADAWATLEWACMYEGDVKVPFEYVRPPQEIDTAIATKDLLHFTDLVNCVANGSTVTSLLNDNGWNCGFSATNKLYDGDYVEHRVKSADSSFLGLSASNRGHSYQTIEYGLYKDAIGKCDIYSNGGHIATIHHSWGVGAVLGLGIDGGKVKAYINGKEVYAFEQAPTLPLVLDCSMHYGRDSIFDMKVGKVPTSLSNSYTITEEKINTAKAEIKVETDSIRQSVSNVESVVTTKESKNSRVIYAKGTGLSYNAGRMLKIGQNTIYADGARGLCLTEINPITLEVTNSHVFDTYGTEADVEAFVANINRINASNVIVVVTSADSCGLSNTRVSNALLTIGGTVFVDGGSYREAYALIGRSNMGKGNGVEMCIPFTEYDNRWAEVSVKVSDDGSFMGVNPNNIGNVLDVQSNKITSVTEKTASLETSVNGIVGKVSNLETTTQLNRKVGAFRYVRDWLKGSTANGGNHWSELQVWAGGVNLARGIIPTSSVGLTNAHCLTDGDISHSPYVSDGYEWVWNYVQLDLGSVRQDVDMIKTFHFWADGRSYNHKLQVSIDGTSWFELFNSDVSGNYPESSTGRTYVINEAHIETRLKSAEQHITPEAITNTVKASQTNGKDTFAQTSTVEQLVDKVTFDFKSSGGTNLLRNGCALKGIEYWAGNGAELTTWVDNHVGTCFRGIVPHGFLGEEHKLKPNTDYVYAGVIWYEQTVTESWGTPLHFWCSENGGAGAEYHIVDAHQALIGGKWTSCYVHFRTPNKTVYFRPFIHDPRLTGYIYARELSLTEATVPSKWTPHADEIYSGNTVIDTNGVTINNGALVVKNKANQTVLSGDSNGNLTVTGTVTGSTIVGSNINGGSVIGATITATNLVTKRELFIDSDAGYSAQLTLRDSSSNPKGYMFIGGDGPVIQSTTDTIAFRTNTNNSTPLTLINGDVHTNEIYNNGWFRAKGHGGLYFQDWGGGFRMTDPTWISTYGGKSLYCENVLASVNGVETHGDFRFTGNRHRWVMHEQQNARLTLARSNTANQDNWNWDTAFTFEPNHDGPHPALQFGNYGSWIRGMTDGSERIQAVNHNNHNYCRVEASGWITTSKREFKENIEPVNPDINFIDVLMNNEIQQYNYKHEMDGYTALDVEAEARGYVLDTEKVKADTKFGFIVEDLTADIKDIINPIDTNGVDMYAMTSTLWKICQEQQKVIQEQSDRLASIEKALGL